MRIALNLATSPLENNRRFLLTTLTVGVIALAALGVLGTHTVREWRQSRDLRNEISTLQSEINELLAERHDLEEFFKDKDTARKMERAALMNRMIVQRSFGWTKMFTDLEELLPTGVRVVSIEPRMDGDRVEVKLVVGAVSDEEKVKFLEALENSKGFSSVQAVGETRPNRPGESDRVLLELQAYYRMGAE
jgi:type IV pilus assembly protein PilN